jgi:hypothetical protein
MRAPGSERKLGATTSLLLRYSEFQEEFNFKKSRIRSSHVVL